ncbi:hypothetical protein FJ872_17935 [Mesorhizobium sp. B2-5-9]|nr:hypothetical protein FJ872_17935 [Mesorhizobium sp. B2-5-9]
MQDIAGGPKPVNSHSKTANKKFILSAKVEPDGQTVHLEGRKQLINAGARGVTPLDLPTGVRMAHYIFLLRRHFVISTRHESHGGDFGGTHARYTLETFVNITEDIAVAA